MRCGSVNINAVQFGLYGWGDGAASGAVRRDILGCDSGVGEGDKE